jgi:hypothetical protein
MEMSNKGWTHFGVEGDRAPNEFGSITLPAGGHQDIVFNMAPKATELISRNLDLHRQYPDWGDVLFFRGALVYVDESGVRRRTSFCRPLEYSTMRFRRIDDPDYDYRD